MGSCHDGEATPFLGVGGPATQQLDQPERQASGMLLAGIAKQREQDGVGEDALVEALAESLDCLLAAG